MKTSNLALQLEGELMAMKATIAMVDEPRIARADLGAEANDSSLRRPRRSLQFQNRRFERRSNEVSDLGLHLFRVR
jgi:hypothetical protein